MAEIRLVPRDPKPSDTLSRLAERHGWKIDKKLTRAARWEESPEYFWRVEGGGTVKLVQSAALNRCYVVVAGAEADTLAAVVQDAIPTFAPAEILDRLSVACSAADRIAALHLVAAAAVPHYDQTIYTAVHAGLEDPDSLIHLAALAAAFYCRWQQFEPLIERMTTSPHAGGTVKEIASNLLGLTHWDRGSKPHG
ncbi:hypothetical protein ACH4OY_28675 [Micromonospora rubida]|uniref:Uncharacterized protein n=1 Tax=Micromonospora rubida TaxID=2697657 RepID=A0ABW7SUY6_9ACTN